MRPFSTEYAGRVQHMKDTWYTTLNVDYGHLLDVSPRSLAQATSAGVAAATHASSHPRAFVQFDPAMATEITSEYYRCARAALCGRSRAARSRRLTLLRLCLRVAQL